VTQKNDQGYKTPPPNPLTIGEGAISRCCRELGWLPFCCGGRAGDRGFRVGLLLIATLLAACNAQPAPTPTPPAIANGAKRLATVYVSPTPNAAEQQATRLAASPTPALVTTPTPSPTVYIGVFLGASGVDAPVIDGNIGTVDITPTRPPVRCALEADPVLGDRWRTEPLVTRGLGCAIEGFFPFAGSRQTFENGIMYGRASGQMWAIAPGEPGLYWFVEQPPEAPEIDVNAPPGLIVPAENFGALWRSRPEIQQALGFARLATFDAALGYQRFEGGTLFQETETGTVFALMVDGLAYGPY
jgi:hypothetical protein